MAETITSKRDVQNALRTCIMLCSLGGEGCEKFLLSCSSFSCSLMSFPGVMIAINISRVLCRRLLFVSRVSAIFYFNPLLYLWRGLWISFFFILYQTIKFIIDVVKIFVYGVGVVNKPLHITFYRYKKHNYNYSDGNHIFILFFLTP